MGPLNELSRREFFQYITQRAAQRAYKSIAKATRAVQAITPPAAAAGAQCARCYARFEPLDDELLCAACRENDAKQRALLEQLPPKE
ncbi:MAG: hypothetical protein HY327_11890 [Chloroflexi bacterium]|nr:hypothetical protein [Chloroflexota bacterium]